VIGSAQADVVDWLHRDRGLLECAWTAQEWVFENRPDARMQGLLLRKVEERLGAGGMGEFQEWARETHFWCELLAQMAFAIAQYEKYRGRIFGMVEDALSQREVSALPDELRSVGAIGFAVQWAWRYVLASVVAASGVGSLATLLSAGDLEPLLWPVRVIAVLMCPDASKHRAVREHCWEPIVRHGKAAVRQEVRNRLTEAFPEHSWFASNQGAL
jgi:hypothetical protein